MRGKRAKQLRAFAKNDTPDVPWIGYTTVVTGQLHKGRMGIKPNETTRLSECGKAYYKLLKRIWKVA